MYLIVGLGNPEKKYEKNRHNIGFQFIDALMQAFAFSAPRKKFNALISEGKIGPNKVLLLKAQTYYNETGRAVKEAASFYKIPVSNLIVVHDELDLAPGKLKVKTGGGNAGNNGLKSITAHMTDQFRRLRIGIGHPGDKSRVTGYVLGDFSKAEREQWVDETLNSAAQAFPVLLDGNADAEGRFLSQLAHKMGKNERPKPVEQKKKTSNQSHKHAFEEQKEGPLASLLRGVFGQTDTRNKEED